MSLESRYSPYSSTGAWIVRGHFPSAGAALGALMLAASFAGLVGCAPPIVLSAPSAATDVAADEPPIVQLRYFSFSPTVSVVAWPAEDAGYGLRASVRRDGSLVREHSLYVGTYFEPWVRGLYLAVAPPRQFRRQGVSRDNYACYFGKCSPFETLGVRITDEYLRANRDSVAMSLYGRDGRALTITLRRDLIDAYLAAVDSVSAALRKRS
jgi:hypothetical protein